MKSFTDAHKDEQLSDNTWTYAQCKTCIFRTKVTVMGREYGYNKGTCEIYEDPQIKPNEIMMNQAICEYYEKDT